ncbi:unnamed protein product [Paramecium sonneborni]|uniref:Uncharacterized protein n=1 Tax=Paramecium sonneborni TaxID=65129 RepID=A0A8S1R8V6_9CILI|nr:unnamed protein product [Paramecium sonneborni]
MNSSSIQSEIGRYTDINHIFETVQKRGYLNQLVTYLEEVFTNEINFASQRLKEVISVMQKQGQKVEYQIQLNRNIQIFKSNFDLILTATSNNVWNQITKQMNQLQDDTIQLNNNKSEIISSVSRKMERQSETDLKKMTLSQSYVSRSPSKISTIKQQQTIPLSEMSIQMRGSPTTFNKAKRQLDNSLTTSSPGVGRYRTDVAEKHIRETSPNATIGKSAKISWIDEKLQKEDAHSPGPIYNPVKTFCSKRVK